MKFKNTSMLIATMIAGSIEVSIFAGNAFEVKSSGTSVHSLTQASKSGNPFEAEDEESTPNNPEQSSFGIKAQQFFPKSGAPNLGIVSSLTGTEKVDAQGNSIPLPDNSTDSNMLLDQNAPNSPMNDKSLQTQTSTPVTQKSSWFPGFSSSKSNAVSTAPEKLNVDENSKATVENAWTAKFSNFLQGKNFPDISSFVSSAISNISASLKISLSADQKAQVQLKTVKQFIDESNEFDRSSITQMRQFISSIGDSIINSVFTGQTRITTILNDGNYAVAYNNPNRSTETNYYNSIGLKIDLQEEPTQEQVWNDLVKESDVNLNRVTDNIPSPTPAKPQTFMQLLSKKSSDAYASITGFLHTIGINVGKFADAAAAFRAEEELRTEVLQLKNFADNVSKRPVAHVSQEDITQNDSGNVYLRLASKDFLSSQVKPDDVQSFSAQVAILSNDLFTLSKTKQNYDTNLQQNQKVVSGKTVIIDQQAYENNKTQTQSVIEASTYVLNELVNLLVQAEEMFGTDSIEIMNIEENILSNVSSSLKTDLITMIQAKKQERLNNAQQINEQLSPPPLPSTAAPSQLPPSLSLRSTPPIPAPETNPFAPGYAPQLPTMPAPTDGLQ